MKSLILMAMTCFLSIAAQAQEVPLKDLQELLTKSA